MQMLLPDCHRCLNNYYHGLRICDIRFEMLYQKKKSKFAINQKNSMEIDLSEHQIKSFVETLRPQDPEIRKQLNIGYSWNKKDLILFEIRPSYLDPEIILNHEFVKITYVQSSQSWKLFWEKANDKWESYKPCPTSNHLEKLLQTIKADDHCCFFG